MSLWLRPEYVPIRPEDQERLMGHPTMGGDPGWWVHVPAVHRVLNNPDGNAWICSMPPAEVSGHEQAAFWFPALYVAVYSLGWLQPGLGLKWWFDAGRPKDDVRLQLLSRVWDRDGRLDLLAAWLWSWPASQWANDIREACGLEQRDQDPDMPRPPTWDSLIARFPEVENPGASPYGPDNDGLHLSWHIRGGVQAGDSSPGLLLVGHRKDRRAVLILDQMQGWYAHLASQGATLPDIGPHSWYVDVVVRPVGFLGTYRKSRATGLWFAGRHRFHAVGN